MTDISPSSSSSSQTASAGSATSMTTAEGTEGPLKGLQSAGHDQFTQAALQNAHRAKIRRTLEQRLGFASYKLSKGWTKYSSKDLEPAIEREVADKRRAARERAEAETRALEQGQSTSHARSETFHQPYPPGQSLFDAMLTPALGGALSGALSPNPDTGSFGARASPPHTHSAKRARLEGPSSAANRLGEASSTSSLKHKGAHVAFDKLPPSGRVSTGPQSAPLAYRPISSSDPHFATSATEYVEAANALTSFTRAQSAGTVEARAPVNGIRRPSSASAVPKDGEERESAAELMLFLAHSPSPQQRASKRPAPADFGALGGASRRLFGEEDGAITTKKTLAPTTGAQENVAHVPPEPRSAPARVVSMPVSTATAVPLQSVTAAPVSRPKQTSASLGSAFDFESLKPAAAAAGI